MTADTIDPRPPPAPARRPPAAPVCAQASSTPAAGPTVLRPGGELDVVSAPDLLREVILLVRGGCREVEVDLRDVVFCDVAGLDALVAARGVLQRRGGTLTVVHGCASLDLLLGVLGADQLPGAPAVAG